MTIPQTDAPSPAAVMAAETAEEFGGIKRQLTGLPAHILFWLCAAYTLFHLLVLNVWPIDGVLYRAIHLGWGSAIGFALIAGWRGSPRHRVPWYDLALGVASLACAGYIWLNLDALQFRAGALFTTGDLIFALLGTVLVLEFARRSAGWAITIICLVFIAYAFVGPWMPGVLYHRGYSFGRFFTYIFSDQGIFGSTLEVSSTFIILFICFAAFLERSRTGHYFNDLSIALVGWARGGPAKVAVVSGVMFGSISGSSVANVVASGSITIPMMRRVGYDRATAGAMEATSSTGGQMTPPVMGAGAFIMAEITGIPYAEIAFAAIIPCLLFYVACYVHADLHALRHGLRGIPRHELPGILPMLAKIYMLAPIVVLVWAFLSGYSGFRAAGLGIIAAVVVSWLSREHRMGPMAVVEALAATARDVMQLVAICAAAGIIVGVIALTGVAGRFSFLLLSIAGESQLLAMIFTMIVAIILGTGMPTTAAYAVAASVLAPGLQKIGISPLVAHMFIFYYAVLSAITPPVAIASFAAAGIAQADPWRTSWIAMRIGMATMIVPFLFFYSPLLLGQGEWLPVAIVTLTACAGVYLLAAATEDWFNGPLNWPLRILLILGSGALIFPHTESDIAGALIGLGVFAWQRYRHGSDPGAKVPSPVLAA